MTTRKKGRTLVVKKQTKVAGSRKSDKGKPALKPGIRESKKGRVYTETRSNRSDVNPKKRI